jgi:hypothetical protein
MSNRSLFTLDGITYNVDETGIVKPFPPVEKFIPVCDIFRDLKEGEEVIMCTRDDNRMIINPVLGIITKPRTESAYFLSNSTIRQGAAPTDKKGYKYGWCVGASTGTTVRILRLNDASFGEGFAMLISKKVL